MFREGALGLLATSPHGAYVTDSAAAASAMSTGFKVANGSVSITPDGMSPPTVMEAAKAAGKRIGLVTTAAVYDATPAAFALHSKSRRDSQALVDPSSPSARRPHGRRPRTSCPTLQPAEKKDGKDVIAAFRARGHQVARTSADLAVSGPKLLALFSEGDMEFEIDRDPAREPTTAEMAAAALKALEQQDPKGFVLLVENENIDTAGHHNDAAALMQPLWAFDDAHKVALEFRRRHPETLVIITGDHETGGFSPVRAEGSEHDVERQSFLQRPTRSCMLERITMSFDAANEKLGKSPSGNVLDQVLAQHFPGFRLDPDLREQILSGKPNERNFSYLPHNARADGCAPDRLLLGHVGPHARACGRRRRRAEASCSVAIRTAPISASTCTG